MRCPDCDTINRDDAAFCGMCKKSFRAPARRSAPGPAPTGTSTSRPSRTPSGVWRALLERLGARRTDDDGGGEGGEGGEGSDGSA